MLVFGHIALGLLAGKGISRMTSHQPNVALLMILSLLPDVDLAFPWVQHRGPTHSVVVAAALYLSFFLLSHRKTLPYFASLASHSLVGDFFTDRGTQLFWPLSNDWVKNQSTLVTGSPFEMILELVLLGTALMAIKFSKNLRFILSKS